MNELYSTSRTAQILDISTQTLKRWYKWYNNDDFIKPSGLTLPTPAVNNQGTMFFTIEQIQELQVFHMDLQTKYRGCMAEFNAAYQWGTRGTKILTVGKQFNNKRKEKSK